MRLVFTIVALSFTVSVAFAQGISTQALDTLGQVSNRQIQEADTSLVKVQGQIDSLQHQINSIQHSLDSLQEQGLSTGKAQDSLQQLLNKGQALQQKLAQEAQLVDSPLAEAGALQQKLGLQEVPVPNTLLPEGLEVSLPLTDLAIPDATLPALATVPDITLPDSGLPNSLSDYSIPDLPLADLPQIDSTTFSSDNIDKNIEQQLLKQKQVAALQEHTELADNPVQEYMQQDAKALVEQQSPELSQQEIQAEAVDHFANNQEALEKARGDLNKYKGRFSEIKSVKELPKNPLKRHPLMGVKWHKRLQPGLQWQIGVGETFRIDIGPRLSYLLTDKLELGASYQERLSVDKTLAAYASFRHDRVYGFNLFGSYEFKKGFYGQLGYEKLNTLMQQLPHQQDPPQDRLWINGIRVGAGKRYTLYKRIRGYSLIEYNFTRSLHAPYRQDLQVKVGVMWDRR